MITLLAESKTMVSNQIDISPDVYQNHKPVFESSADEIMGFLASLSPAEISQKLGISQQLGIKARNFAYDFSHKLAGYSAIYAFIGEAFRALDVSSLSKEVVDSSQNRLRIISSIYGILKPFDIIKPYRCEFNKPITPDNKTAIQFFKQKATIEFVNFIKDNKIKEVIDLLPGDADKCLDWKIIRAFAHVQKVVFQVIKPDGNLKTPIASRLKELRGLMARSILQNNIQSFEELKSRESHHYVYSPNDSKTFLPVFISTE